MTAPTETPRKYRADFLNQAAYDNYLDTVVKQPQPELKALYELPHLAATYTQEHGWTQGTEQDQAGHVCLTGALRLCSPIPGDGYIAREVFRRRGRAESWNDAKDRTADEVIAYLASTEITDEELAETFGPQWFEIIGQVRAISGATPQQVKDLAAAWDAAGDAAWAAAWAAAGDAAWAAAGDAAWAAAGDAARDAAGAAAWDAAWAAAGDAAWAAAGDAAWAAAGDAAWAAAGAAAGAAAWDAAWAAAGDAAWAAAGAAAWAAARAAARALVVRDLIGQHGFTQQHYDTLTGPWRKVIGPLHPDDAALTNG